MAGTRKISLIGLVAICLAGWASMSANAGPPRAMPRAYPRPIMLGVPRPVPLAVYRPVPGDFPGVYAPYCSDGFPPAAIFPQAASWGVRRGLGTGAIPFSIRKNLPIRRRPGGRPRGRSTITLVNRSGKPVLARLVGPTRGEVTLDDGQGGSIRYVRPGTYAFVVRLRVRG